MTNSSTYSCARAKVWHCVGLSRCAPDATTISVEATAIVEAACDLLPALVESGALSSVEATRLLLEACAGDDACDDSDDEPLRRLVERSLAGGPRLQRWAFEAMGEMKTTIVIKCIEWWMSTRENRNDDDLDGGISCSILTILKERNAASCVSRPPLERARLALDGAFEAVLDEGEVARCQFVLELGRQLQAHTIEAWLDTRLRLFRLELSAEMEHIMNALALAGIISLERMHEMRISLALSRIVSSMPEATVDAMREFMYANRDCTIEEIFAGWHVQATLDDELVNELVHLLNYSAASTTPRIAVALMAVMCSKGRPCLTELQRQTLRVYVAQLWSPSGMWPSSSRDHLARVAQIRMLTLLPRESLFELCSTEAIARTQILSLRLSCRVFAFSAQLEGSFWSDDAGRLAHACAALLNVYLDLAPSKWLTDRQVAELHATLWRGQDPHWLKSD